MINFASKLANDYWEKGKLEDCPVIDFHAHMWESSAGFMPNCSTEGILRSMDSCNVILACFCSHDALGGFSKDKDMDAVLKYPDRLKAYHIVFSKDIDPETEIKRVEDNPDLFIGFKFLCDYYKVELSDKRHDQYFDYANKKGLLTLSHTWGGSRYNGPEEAEKVLDRYQNLIFIAGHSFFGDWEKAVSLVRKYPNIYLELTAVHAVRGPLDFLIEKVGSERILFGVDMPWFSYYNGIGAVLSAKMTDEDRRNIFYRNGEKILSRFSWFKKNLRREYEY